MGDIKLIGCPFCGGNDQDIGVTRAFEGVYVGDVTCSCGCQIISGDYATEEEAIAGAAKAWNTRQQRKGTCHWEWDDTEGAWDTECDNKMYWDTGLPPYCPNCGSEVVECWGEEGRVCTAKTHAPAVVPRGVTSDIKSHARKHSRLANMFRICTPLTECCARSAGCLFWYANSIARMGGLRAIASSNLYRITARTAERRWWSHEGEHRNHNVRPVRHAV